MIVRAAKGIEVLEHWATEYQKKNTRQSRSGLIVPKAQVAAIRGGDSTYAKVAPQICSVYLGAYTSGPGSTGAPRRDHRALRNAGIPASDVELYLFRRGYQAVHADRIIAAVEKAHLAMFGSSPPPPNPATCSMWRDINIFNELGIPPYLRPALGTARVPQIAHDRLALQGGLRLCTGRDGYLRPGETWCLIIGSLASVVAPTDRRCCFDGGSSEIDSLQPPINRLATGPCLIAGKIAALLGGEK